MRSGVPARLFPNTMTILDLPLLLGAGFLAGAVNAVAGGGTFFTFSALVAVGLPPVVANATSAVAVTPGNLASSFAYRDEILANLRRFGMLALISTVGGLIGAIILTRIDNADFRRLVPWLLLVATALFAASPLVARLGERIAPGSAAGRSRRLGGLAFQFLISIYGGFFGAGMGIVMLAALAVTEGEDFHVINSAKNLCGTLIQLMSLVIFVVAGLVRWPEAAAIAAACFIGGYAGVLLGRRVPPLAARLFVVTTGALLTLVFFWRG